MTESSTVVTSTPYNDIVFGSSGCLLPSIQARIVSEEGVDITDHDQAGELLVKSPTVVLGYLNNDEANTETFEDGWLRTGDKAVIRRSAKGNEHVWIVDRVKELIKVKVTSNLHSRDVPLTHSRVYKLPRRNSKPICSPIPPLQMLQSFLFQTTVPARFQRPLS